MSDIPLIRALDAMGDAQRGAMLAIGNFDGVHIGHRRVLADAKQKAEAMGAPLGVLLFEPHPRLFFAPDTAPFRLTRLATRHRLLAGCGVDFVLALPFDAVLAERSAQSFIDDILCDAMRVKGVAIGGDFRFGKGRAGTLDMMRARSEAKGFTVSITQTVMQNDGTPYSSSPYSSSPYSSSAIRTALAEGDPKRAGAMLGRAWTIEGEVREGDRRGRTIGFPTANIALEDYTRPAYGVYVVATRHEDRLIGGVANLGMRPTVGTDAPRLEAHFFDFDGDLYGQEMRVALLDFLRPERKFDGLDALKKQIAQDSAQARTLYNYLQSGDAMLKDAL